MKHYTSIEQSKKLLKLGLDPESADMLYTFGNPDIVRVRLTKEHWKQFIGAGIIPCWSLGALLEVMPVVIYRVGRFRLNYTLHTTGHKRVVYSHKVMVFHKESGKNLIEAAYSMVIWLLENGYIKKKAH